MTKTKSTYLALLAVLLSPMAANADPITYVYSGFGASGSLGGVLFEDVDFVITALADTDNIGPWCCSDGQNTHISTTILIDGFSIADILTASHSWYSLGGIVGIGRDLSANWMTFSGAALSGYDLSTSIGPFFGTAVNVNQFNNVSTSAGILSFTDSSLSGSFQAITSVPEPGTLALLGIGLLGMAAARRRRKV